MQRLSSEQLVTGLDANISPCENCPKYCEACIEGKHARPPFGESSRPAVNPLDRIHIDTVGPISPAAISGERFWVTVADEASGWKAVLPVKSKDVIAAVVQDLILYWQTERGTTVKCIRCDRGTEFINARFKEFCASQAFLLAASPAVEHGGSVSGPWAQHFHTTYTRKYTHRTFWQQRLAKSTNILRTSDEQFLGRPVKARLQQHKVQLPKQSLEFELVRIMWTPSPMGNLFVSR